MTRVGREGRERRHEEGREEGRKGGKEEVMAGSTPENRLVSQGLNWNEEDAPEIQPMQPEQERRFPHPRPNWKWHI